MSKDPRSFDLPDNFYPTEFDVICGWARQNYNHGGNRRLREIIAQNVHRYQAAKSKVEKGQLIIEIVSRLRQESPSGAGFVKLNRKTGKWYFIGIEKAKDKIGHALRKAAQGQQRKRPRAFEVSSTREEQQHPDQRSASFHHRDVSAERPSALMKEQQAMVGVRIPSRGQGSPLLSSPPVAVASRAKQGYQQYPSVGQSNADNPGKYLTVYQQSLLSPQANLGGTPVSRRIFELENFEQEDVSKYRANQPSIRGAAHSSRNIFEQDQYGRAESPQHSPASPTASSLNVPDPSAATSRSHRPKSSPPRGPPLVPMAPFSHPPPYYYPPLPPPPPPPPFYHSGPVPFYPPFYAPTPLPSWHDRSQQQSDSSSHNEET